MTASGNARPGPSRAATRPGNSRCWPRPTRPSASSPVRPDPNSNYTSTSEIRADALTTSTPSLNAHHELSRTGDRTMPLPGRRDGRVLPRVDRATRQKRILRHRSAVYRSSRSGVSRFAGHRPVRERPFQPPLRRCGLLGDGLLLDLKAPCGWVDDIEDTSPCDLHPVSRTSEPEISGIGPGP